MDRMNRIGVFSFQFLEFEISNCKFQIKNQKFSYPVHPVHPYEFFPLDLEARRRR
jgi:hypothetical protein